MIHRYLTLRQVAEAMGVSPALLYRRRAALERDHGFPRAAPGMGKLVDAAAVEAWQERAMPAALRPDAAPAPADAIDWPAELDRRAAELGDAA